MKSVKYSLLLLVAFASLCGFSVVESKKDCELKRLSTSKLICYYSTLEEVNGCYCTHVILPATSDFKRIEALKGKGVKVFVRVNEFNQGVIDLLKSTKVDGLELNLKKLDSKNDITDFISTIKTKLGSDLDIALSVPSKAELVAKYFDFKALSKHAELFILQTAFLGASTNVTFHPSRLSGMWDMQNTDSLVDLVTGLGAPLPKLVVTAPVQAYQFQLQNPEYTAPGSPAVELKSITRDELCNTMQNNKNWTLERDEDQAGPYIFDEDKWIAFEDTKSIDIKAKYARVRGLAGVALKDLVNDGGSECGTTILEATYNGLSRQARAPRRALLQSLEREIVDSSGKPLESVQLSPFRISRIIDTEGKIHIIRQDSRTEFQCSRQGYFVHPRSCNRFYRCVKFDQLKEDYNVFEFDCPAGLAFDERVEVCVWPGSLPHGTPCSGSSEIAPVPRERFVCPSEPGYYADPENCRWFFACLDHGKSPLQAYEFRCPFGLVFDGEKLVCEWPWLVPKCSSGGGTGLDSEFYYGSAQNGNALDGHAINGAAGVILQNYDGLGGLGAVKLGGVSGRIEKPITTLYSNAASGTLGLGYHNRQGYIEGSGLSYAAAQALQNAGLLRVNNGVNYQALGHVEEGNLQQVSTGAGQADANGVEFSSGGSGENYYNSGQYDASGGHGTVNGYQAQDNLVALEGAGAKGAAVSSQSFTQYHGQGTQTGSYQLSEGSVYNSANSGYATNTAAGSYDYNGANYATFKPELQTVGYNLNQEPANFQGGFDYASTVSDFGVKLQNNGENSAGAAVSSESYTQYRDQNQAKNAQQFGTGVVGGINIIGGGYSAVGTLPNVNEFSNNQGQLATASPRIISVAKIPTVTAVPVPGIKAVTGFDTIRGGVIANIPELQYKVKSFEDAGLFTNDSTNHFVNFVVTSAPNNQQTYSQTGGYIYSKPAVSFEEGPIQTVSTPKPFAYISSTARPFGVVEEKPISQLQGVVYSTPKPFAVVQPAVSEVTFQKYNSNGGYKYGKPLVKFEETYAVSTSKPAELVEQPQLIVSSTPAPLSLSTYNYQDLNVNQGGYGNRQASVVSKFSIGNSVVQQTGTSGSYYYQKPSVQFEEKPAVLQQPTVIDEIPVIKQKQAIEDYTYQQPQQYYYQQQTVPLNQQPERLSTYTYQPLPQKQPTVTPYTYQSIAQQAVHYKQPAISVVQPVQSFSYQPSRGASYQYINTHHSQKETSDSFQKQGYVYSKPTIAFEEQPQSVSIGTYQFSTPKPSVVLQNTPVLYSTPKPAQPAIVTSYFNIQNSKAKAESEAQQANEGYIYSKPTIGFQENPVTYSTSKPAVAVQPAVVTSYFNIQNSKAQAESEAQQANVGYTYPKPAVDLVEAPLTYSTSKPAVSKHFEVSTQPAVVSSYFNLASAKANGESSQEQVNVGYSYHQPNVQLVDAPVSYSTPKQPAVVSSYFNTENSKAHSQSAQEHQRHGYTYSKPLVQFEEIPTVYSTSKPAVEVKPLAPAIVTSYFNIQSGQSKSESAAEQARVSYSGDGIQEAPVVYSPAQAITYSTPKPYTASSYFHLGSSKTSQESGGAFSAVTYSESPVVSSTTRPVLIQENIGYSYPKSRPETSYNYIESTTAQPILVQEQPVISAKPAVVTSYFHQQPSKGYAYSKPAIAFEEERQPVQEVPFVKKTAYVTGQQEQNYENNYRYQNTGKVVVEDYKPLQYEPVEQAVYAQDVYEQQPQVVYNYVPTTPRPTFISTVKAIAEQPVTPALVTIYDSRYSSTPFPQVVSSTAAPEVRVIATTSRPISKYSFNSLDEQYQYNNLVKATTAQPLRTYIPVTSTVRVTTGLPKVSKVIEEFVAPEYKEYLPQRVRAKTPSREYLPVEITTPAREYLPIKVRTKAPARQYVPVEVTTPSREYLPAPSRKYLPSRRVKVTSTTAAPEITTLSREYLPVRTRVTTGKPSGSITIIKSNDAHPLLSAKLGAQCTCVSNNLRLRKKQKIIIVDDDDEDDGYAVDNGNALVGYEAQRVVDITPTPDVYVKGSGGIGPQSYAKKLVKVKPAIKEGYYTPVTDVSEIFYQKNTSPAPEATDKEIIKAVRTGLKLVKQAAKEGAKEGTAEVLSKQLDRYGPGGVRSRSETLQGTIDCQRAGLFRHPTECNKFYACRWDCTKNRFTLHVFNCPVHLTFDNNLGACNWPSQGPTCVDNTLITSD